ncbi:MAG TPA: hypothetical protein PLG04_02980 [Anaerolineaceae bacterium]|jgi:hypothetical protein|nr:hypothetical protein [Syntrophorhabdaceae bacterium]HOR77755.1 hypothetical protein [Anaerolineaceae bacterium]HPL48872.1 hypothetical protein [Smithella sp.]
MKKGLSSIILHKIAYIVVGGAGPQDVVVAVAVAMPGKDGK